MRAVIAGVSWVRDEIDIIELSVRHHAEICDRLIVADHGSIDGTREVLYALKHEDGIDLEVVEDDSGTFRQADAMNELVAMADGADWIVPFDADEFWNLPATLAVHADVLVLPVHDHVNVVGYHGYDLPPWRQHRASMSKVLFRPGERRRLTFGNHHVDGAKTRLPGVGGWVRHFPNRSRDQFLRKVRRGVETYPGTEYGAHWRRMLDEIETDGLEAVWTRFVRTDLDGLVYDPYQPQSST